jgi:hypothetical protein
MQKNKVTGTLRGELGAPATKNEGFLGQAEQEKES